ncbi:MAG TPA: hypothetical protein VJS11_04675 [Acidobacteriaceae bacterium]|nr:hypothetical protein [Acidobacteriaceae bacterium]
MFHKRLRSRGWFVPLSLWAASAGAQMTMGGPAHTFVQEIEAHATSGTSAEPNSTPAPMLMTMQGGWMLMLHGNGFLSDIQQTSLRGGDKLFSTNWAMGMAQRNAGPGLLTLRTMLSLEPATVTGRRYPLLFQQGETAYGAPIVDGQHPHNFVMEAAALYDLHIGKNALLSFYAAPVGDPGIGPIAYPHRASALEDPVATLGHHQEDSTHISDDVVTAGLTVDWLRVEASGFHGREPNEHRWQVQQGAIDSWSVRVTAQPGQNWSGQYSWGRLHSPEALFPGDDQDRQTASVMYNRPVGKGANWASTLAWGRTRDLPGGLVQNSYLLESTVQFAQRNHTFTRIEDVDRTTELLLGERALPPGFDERSAGRVQAYTFGYDRTVGHVPHLESALGAQATVYTPGSRLKPVYGSDPAGFVVFLRMRIKGGV